MSIKVVLPTIILTLLTWGVSASIEDDIINRISPVGEVCMAGEPCAAPVVAIAAGPRTGDEIYNANCMACHNTGAAGAPKIGDVAEWQKRADKSLETLYANAIGGIGGMPAMGLCASCSEEDIKTTVDYMLAESQ